MPYNNLFKPILINNTEINNRIVLPAVEMGFGGLDGSVTNDVIDFYVSRARGGVGLIIVGAAFIDISSRIHPYALLIDDDMLIEGYKNLINKIKEYGTKTLLQIMHYGPMAPSHLTGGLPLAPSKIPSKLTGEQPKELTKEEIKDLEIKFGDAAYRAYKAGFDGVEIHAGVGSLISRFLSPVTNKREDEYGGDINSRTRFLLEIINEIKRRVPKNFILGCRISAEDWLNGGNTLEDTKIIVKKLEDEGLHYINIVLGWHESPRPLISREVPQGGYIQYAYKIKKVVSIPVIGGIRVKWPDLADKLIGEGKIDMVFLGRALIADPEWPLKAREGRVKEIRPCIACLNCLSRIFEESRVECTVNPRLTMELSKVPRSTKPKNILIIGAGPAGLEAAINLAYKGHNVTVVDKRGFIGGTINIASKPPYKAELLDLIRYYETMLRKYNVKVILNNEVDLNFVNKIKPDIIILASGAILQMPNIPGIELPHVLTATKVLEEDITLKGEVAIIGGGGVGLDVADYLSDKGVKPYIIEMLPRVGLDIPRAARWIQIVRLKSMGVNIYTNTKLMEIKKNHIIVRVNNDIRKIKADHVIIATGMTPNNQLVKELREAGYRVFTVGDCKKPARILDAIKDGFIISLVIR